MSSAWEQKYGRGRVREASEDQHQEDTEDIASFLEDMCMDESRKASSALRMLRETYLEKKKREEEEEEQVWVEEPSHTTEADIKHTRRLAEMLRSAVAVDEDPMYPSRPQERTSRSRKDDLFDLGPLHRTASRKASAVAHMATEEAWRRPTEAQRQEQEAERRYKKERAKKVRSFRNVRLYRQVSNIFLRWRGYAGLERRRRLERQARVGATRRQLLLDLAEVEEREQLHHRRVLIGAFKHWKYVHWVRPALMRKAGQMARGHLFRKVVRAWRAVVDANQRKQDQTRREMYEGMARDLYHTKLQRVYWKVWVTGMKVRRQQRALSEQSGERSKKMEQFLKHVRVTRQEQEKQAEEERQQRLEQQRQEEEERLARLKQLKEQERELDQQRPVKRSESRESVRQRLQRPDSTRQFQKDLEESRASRKAELAARKAALEAEEREQRRQKRVQREKQKKEQQRLVEQARLREQQEQAEEEERKRHARRMAHELRQLAEMHYTRAVIVFQGWMPWMRLVEARRRLRSAAEALSDRHLTRRMFLHLRRACHRSEVQRLERARRVRQVYLQRSTVQALRRYLRGREKMTRRCAAYYQDTLVRRLFLRLKTIKVSNRIRRETVLMDHEGLTTASVMRRFFIRWKRFTADAKLQSRMSSKVREAMSRVSSWLEPEPDTAASTYPLPGNRGTEEEEDGVSMDPVAHDDRARVEDRNRAGRRALRLDVDERVYEVRPSVVSPLADVDSP